MPEVIRCVLLCMLEVLEDRLCLLGVLVVMRRMLCMLRPWTVRSFFFAGGAGRAGGDTPWATLYA